jgi:hypothetical protein
MRSPLGWREAGLVWRRHAAVEAISDWFAHPNLPPAKRSH